MKNRIPLAIGVMMVSLIVIVLNMLRGTQKSGQDQRRGFQSATLTNQSPETPQAQSNRFLLTNRYARRSGTLDATIDFWGKVIDEDGDPVPSATVTLAIRSWGDRRMSLFQNARFSEETLIADDNGLFAVTNRVGDSLNIRSIGKPGFSLIRSQEFTFSYGRPGDTLPQSDDPKRFVMVSEKHSSSAGLRRFEHVRGLDATMGFWDLI